MVFPTFARRKAKGWGAGGLWPDRDHIYCFKSGYLVHCVARIDDYQLAQTKLRVAFLRPLRGLWFLMVSFPQAHALGLPSNARSAGFVLGSSYNRRARIEL